MQITTLGVSGSGKSNFMFTLMDLLRSPANAVNGFYIKGKGHAFEDSLQRREHSIIENRVFARGTAAETNREFELRYITQNSKLFDINWFDYQGGIVNQYLTDQEDQYNEYFRILKQSSAMLIFVNLYDIFNEADLVYLQDQQDFEEKPYAHIAELQRYIGAVNITNIFTQLQEDGHKNLDILFILSQCDAVSEHLWNSVDAIEEIYEKILRPVFGSVFRIIEMERSWKCGIIATSCIGMGNGTRTITDTRNANRGCLVIDEIIGEPKPHNILNAFFWLLKQEFKKQNRINEHTLSNLRKDLQRLDGNYHDKVSMIDKDFSAKKSKRPYFVRLIEDRVFKDDTNLHKQRNSDLDSAEREYESQKMDILNKIEEIERSRLPNNLLDLLIDLSEGVYEL